MVTGLITTCAVLSKLYNWTDVQTSTIFAAVAYNHVIYIQVAMA